MSLEEDLTVLRQLRPALSEISTYDYDLGEALRVMLEDTVPTSNPQERARLLMRLSEAMCEDSRQTGEKGLVAWSNALAVAAVNQEGLGL